MPMLEPRRCAHTADSLDRLYQWPRGTVVTYCIQVDLDTAIRRALAESTIADATEVWSRVCGIEFKRVDDPSQCRLWIRSAPIDGPYNILGQTELPVEGRADVRHTMTLDSGEPWSIQELHECVIHEAGHGIGLVHSPPGVVAIMAPVLNIRVTAPLSWDIAQAQIRYGEPTVKPAPAPAPAPSGPAVRWRSETAPDGTVTIDFGAGRIGAVTRNLKLSWRPATPQPTDDFAYGPGAAGSTEWQQGIGTLDGKWLRSVVELGDPIG